MGQLVLTNSYKNFMSEVIEINMGDYKNGIYFVKIISEELNAMKKVVLNK